MSTYLQANPNEVKYLFKQLSILMVRCQIDILTAKCLVSVPPIKNNRIKIRQRIRRREKEYHQRLIIMVFMFTFCTIITEVLSQSQFALFDYSTTLYQLHKLFSRGKGWDKSAVIYLKIPPAGILPERPRKTTKRRMKMVCHLAKNRTGHFPNESRMRKCRWLCGNSDFVWTILLFLSEYIWRKRVWLFINLQLPSLSHWNFPLCCHHAAAWRVSRG